MLNWPTRPLLAVAVLACGGAAAQAQTVNVYGLFDLSAGRNQDPGQPAAWGVDSGKMTTSNFGLRGTEDLGDGLKAQFVLEAFLRADTGAQGRFNGDGFWSRNAFVALESPYGTLQVGRLTTGLFVQTLSHNAFGDSFGFSAPIRHWFASSTLTGDSGWSDSLRYITPRVGGLSAAVHAALGEGNGGRNLGANLQYGQGALSAGLAWQRVEKGSTVGDTTGWQLAASYDLKVVKLMGQYGVVEQDNVALANRWRLAGLGLTAPVGPLGVLRAQWGQIDPRTGAERRTLTLGYSYNMSKRTELYGAWMKDRLDNVGTGTSYAVGVRHRY
jgi:predicted porin